MTGYFLDGTAGLTFVPVDGSRILDTRFGVGLSNQFAANIPRTWVVTNRGGVGSDAQAIIGNVTVVGQTKAGYVSLTPTPQANPTTSTINFPLGDTRANNFTIESRHDLAQRGLQGVERKQDPSHRGRLRLLQVVVSRSARRGSLRGSRRVLFVLRRRLEDHAGRDPAEGEDEPEVAGVREVQEQAAREIGDERQHEPGGHRGQVRP